MNPDTRRGWEAGTQMGYGSRWDKGTTGQDVARVWRTTEYQGGGEGLAKPRWMEPLGDAIVCGVCNNSVSVNVHDII